MKKTERKIGNPEQTEGIPPSDLKKVMDFQVMVFKYFHEHDFDINSTMTALSSAFLSLQISFVRQNIAKEAWKEAIDSICKSNARVMKNHEIEFRKALGEETI
jgi:hypothetical protein